MALSNKPLEEMVKFLDVPDPSTDAITSEACINKEGVFRIILDNEVFARDRTMTDETFMAEVVAALHRSTPG